MSKAGSRILASARQALAYATGEADTSQYGVHVPATLDVRAFILFIATSLGWDVPRGILCALMVATLGRPVLAAFRRTARKAAFDTPVGFTEAPRG